MKFNDFGVQLLVLDALLENEAIEAPYATGHDWVEAEYDVDFSGAEDIIYGDELFDKMLPAAERWAREFDFSEEQLDSITGLYWDGGNEVYHLLCPSWDGEQDLFTVGSWAEVTPERFPNLEELSYGICEPPTEQQQAALEAAGVEISDF